MDRLVDEVEEIRGNVVNKKSKEVYAYGIVKFIVWLHANQPEAVTPLFWDLLNGVGGEDESLVIAEDFE
ncbi:hypothetical protein F441_00451 [Phytophthora nicotianae CJ01A1]|uniref:PWI domain-containing protein n=2 Tax=Phytophthora nicotianae TaxID=4792 RepID=W2JVD0_PHYNI|nr:hypothetical protein L915_00420 [Phytophthora nicotianae]ETL50321.1 hypothetical protein L916_00423 [Phytophthora nicotianae]ETM03382.1 hypothetical protein L917_00395 [Phytophthora nicotianae]ETP26985.1 hypothetical protein F441_00451 [Phytophthora nicotianae CJ01A1]